MSRILVLAVVAIVLFGSLFAADQMLQNPEVEPTDADDQTAQQDFAELSATLIDATPVLLLVLAIGAALAGVRRVGAG
jgi:hypothetical protein